MLIPKQRTGIFYQTMAWLSILYALTVVVDPGHGGKNQGVSGCQGKVVESSFTLSLADKLSKELNRSGIKAVLTRYDDYPLDWRKRTEIANREKPDLYLSLHLANAPKPYVRGMHLFMPELVPPTEPLLAQELTTELGAVPPMIPVNYVQPEHVRIAMSYATLLKAHANRMGALSGVPIRQDAGRFLPLLGVQAPSLMIELGYVTNPIDCELLQDRSHVDSLVSWIRESTVTLSKSLPPAN